MEIRPLAATPRDRTARLFMNLPPEPEPPRELVTLRRRERLHDLAAIPLAALDAAPALSSHPVACWMGIFGCLYPSVALGAMVGCYAEDHCRDRDWVIPVAMFGTMGAGLALGVASSCMHEPVLWALNGVVQAAGLVATRRLHQMGTSARREVLEKGYQQARATWQEQVDREFAARGVQGPRAVGETADTLTVGGVRLPKKTT